MSDDRQNTVIMYDEAGNQVVLSIIEETKFNGKNYILAADENYLDEDAEESECYVFRDDSLPDAEEALYVTIDNDDELSGVLDIFQNLLDEEIEE